MEAALGSTGGDSEGRATSTGLDLAGGTWRLRRGVTNAALQTPPPARERGAGLGFNYLPSSAAHALRSLNRHRDPGNVVHPPLAGAAGMERAGLRRGVGWEHAEAAAGGYKKHGCGMQRGTERGIK